MGGAPPSGGAGSPGHPGPRPGPPTPDDPSVDSISIDVRQIVQRSVASLYSHLVTRPTGQAVRAAIENQLFDVGTPSLSLIDLSEVTVLDFSCADEVVAKLILRYLRADRPRDAFFVFRGIQDRHRGPVQAVLDRHALAAVAQDADVAFALMGTHSGEEARIWELVEVRGLVRGGEIATVLPIDSDRATLANLAERRLVFQRPGSGDVQALSTLVRDLV